MNVLPPAGRRASSMISAATSDTTRPSTRPRHPFKINLVLAFIPAGPRKM